MGTARVEQGLLDIVGGLSGAPIRSEAAADVPEGGVLCTLAAILALGLLLRSGKHFTLPSGYYPLETVFLDIGFLALARVGSLEALRYEQPRGMGAVAGSDRIPEVRTLRERLRGLSREEQPVREWSETLARDWMEAEPESAGALYVDGHVRVYHAWLTKLLLRIPTQIGQ